MDALRAGQAEPLTALAGEQQDLPPGGEILKQLERKTQTLVVKVDQGVVENQGSGILPGSTRSHTARRTAR